MVEQPLLMKAEEINLFGEFANALWDGSTRQLRFALTPQPTHDPKNGWRWLAPKYTNGRKKGLAVWPQLAPFLAELAGLCPYGQPGDHLWVKEAWKTVSGYDALKPSELRRDLPNFLIDYVAAGEGFCAGRYRHAPCLPRWASRLVLEITSIRVQRAWDMTDADALASGIKRIPRGYADGVGGLHVTAKAAYRSFWLTVRGTDWHSNPWVWVITCKQAKEPPQPTTPATQGRGHPSA